MKSYYLDDRMNVRYEAAERYLRKSVGMTDWDEAAGYWDKARKLMGDPNIFVGDSSKVRRAYRKIEKILNWEGNMADEYAADYARFAVEYGLDPAKVSKWAHLATLEVEDLITEPED